LMALQATGQPIAGGQPDWRGANNGHDAANRPAFACFFSSLLGQQVGLALRLIGSGICPPVLQMALGGFDTHANQALRHARVLSQLAESLVALDFGLQQMPRRPQVTLMAASEFGRRFRENASRGTDHGSASVAFFYGDDVPHPFLGRYPDLDKLDERGDLIPTLAPISLYRRVLRDVRGVDPNALV
jgi:uncharacterized protein (DUF1501 family)